jgi:Cu(I)/Ag(I) efflux system membrane fusion protein
MRPHVNTNLQSEQPWDTKVDYPLLSDQLSDRKMYIALLSMASIIVVLVALLGGTILLLFQAKENIVAKAAIDINQTQSTNAVQLSIPSGTGEEINSEPTSNNKSVIAVSSTAAGKETALGHALKHQDPSYVCPMHSQIIGQDPNATCPICGMDLVEYKVRGDSDVVSISPRMINMLGVRTVKVKKRNLYRRIDSIGYIKFNQDKIRSVSLRTDGWVERLAVKSIGDQIKKGQVLLEFYSPKLVNAQEEYIHALGIEGSTLLAASRERLLSLGVSVDAINELKITRVANKLVKIYAPQNGVITELSIHEGNYVPQSKSVISVADMSSVWLVVNIYESQAGWVKVGQRAKAKLPFLEDKIWEGKVDYVYPSLNSKTRSLEVRIRFDNPEIALKPNMYADVTIFAEPKRNIVVLPRESIIDDGKNQRVILALGEGRYKPRDVKTGMESNGKVEIVHGIEEGDEVVTSSQFLIDSESSLQASMSRM